VGMSLLSITPSGVATAPYSVYSHDEGIDFQQYVRDVGQLFSCEGRYGTSELRDVVDCLRRVPQQDIIDKRGDVYIRLLSRSLFILFVCLFLCELCTHSSQKVDINSKTQMRKCF